MRRSEQFVLIKSTQKGGLYLDRDVFNKAFNIISSRRANALSVSEANAKEISEKVPEIVDLQHSLAVFTQKAIYSNQDMDIKSKIADIRKLSSETNKRISEILQKNNYPIDFLDEKFFCSKCNDTGYIKNEYCDCLINLVKQISSDKLNQSTKIAKEVSFETVNLDYYGAYKPLMSMMFQCCKMYAENFTANSGSLFMHGSTGLGKTHFSLSIANAVLKKGNSVIYHSSLDLFGILEKEYFKKDKDMCEKTTMEAITSADLLILDDLGAEMDNKFYKTSLYEILEKRINAQLPMIINSNLDIKKISEKYGERIGSRLSAFSIYEFQGYDIRLLKSADG